MVDMLWMAAGSFLIAIVSALVPWVNAELLMLSMVPLAGSSARLALLVALVTLGQMIGKTIMYWASRRATQPRARRLQQAVDRWRKRLGSHPGSALGVIFTSATTGLPPFYVVSVAAGALKMGFGRFLAIGTAGRLLHFALVAFAPQLIWRNL
jgi:membrane protein YqaA with SNARE-associated domain